MAIQDSDPERRNLIVTSLAFIAYFYAGGSFPDTSVRLQVINANFSRPGVLGVMAWVAFIWFIYRYWQTHSGDFSSAFKKEFSRWQLKDYIINYVRRRVGQDIITDQDEGYHINDITWQGHCVVINCLYGKNAKRNSEGIIDGFYPLSHDNQYDRIKMTDFSGWILAIRASLEYMFIQPSFSSYIAPYIFALIAMGGAIARNVIQVHNLIRENGGGYI